MTGMSVYFFINKTSMDFKDVLIRFLKHHIPFENKGILIPVYWIVSFISTVVIFEYLHEKNIMPKGEHNLRLVLIISFVITGVWALLTSNDYYKNDDGEKVKVEIDNSFFWIKMKYWIYIFLALALIVVYKSNFF